MTIWPNSRVRHWVAASAVAFLFTGAFVTPTNAQQTQLEVLVEQIAGTNIYLHAGTDSGLAVHDTLLVLDEPGGAVIGALRVISATASRSVAEFVDEPFPLTRGTTLSLRLGTGVADLEPSPERPQFEEPAAARGAERDRGVQARNVPRVRGRLSLQFNALESTTRWQSNAEESLSRQFATPSLGFRLNVSDLPGGIEFNSNVRAAYRYTSNDLVQPAHSTRVYQLGVKKSFEKVPVQVQVGRFFNPYETYSGYWDGMLMHYGDRGLGVGFVAGFEPDHADEGVSTSLPKYTAFIDFNHVNDRAAYYSDVSLHRLMPGDGLAAQTFFGWSQRLTIAQTRLGTDVQVHRDPVGQSWSVTRLHADGSLNIAPRVSLLARYAFDRPENRFYMTELFSYERKRASLGVRYWNRGGNASVYVTSNKFNSGVASYSVSSAFGLTRTAIMGLGIHGAGTVWFRESARAIDVMAGVDRVFGQVQSRASYRLYRTSGMNATLLSHAVDASIVFPLAPRVYSTLTGRVQRGSNQTGSSVFVSIWTAF